LWALFEQGELQPETALTGHFAFDESEIDVDSVMQSIIDAREEALIRQQGREAALAEG
jgi:RIO kinase 1